MASAMLDVTPDASGSITLSWLPAAGERAVRPVFMPGGRRRVGWLPLAERSIPGTHNDPGDFEQFGQSTGVKPKLLWLNPQPCSSEPETFDVASQGPR